MKQIQKSIVSAGLAAALAVSAAVPAFAFYRTPANKKGILSSHVDLISDMQNLGCSQVIFNYPVSLLNDSWQRQGMDAYIRSLDNAGLTTTMIVLNDWKDGDPMMPTQAPTGAAYYAFNAATQEGQNRIRSTAQQLVSLYGNQVSNWIIGNEINNGITWNQTGTYDLGAYCQNYAASFRIFYDTIKAANPEARIFIPFDFRWNCPTIAGWFNVNQVLPQLNAQLRDLDYGIAWHAYPENFSNPDFMNASPNAPDSPDSAIINLKNLHVLTDYMQQADMLSPAGTVRHLILSEQGFTSSMGEDLQAACIAQAYSMANQKPFVEAFYLNRLVDAPGEVAQGYSFGLWNCNGQGEIPTTRKAAWDAYRNAQ